MPGKTEQAGMERFSVYFDGPPDLRLLRDSIISNMQIWEV